MRRDHINVAYPGASREAVAPHVRTGPRRLSRIRGQRLVATALLSWTIAAGCSITQTPFQRTVSDAASILGASSQTLRFAHGQPALPVPGQSDDPHVAARLTYEYARGAFINYSDLLRDVSNELPTLEGAPDARTTQALVDALQSAADVVESPCLAGDCDWQGQIATIEGARQALMDAL